jgi:serine/threonine-protein kinase
MGDWAVHELLIGQRVSNYQVVERLGAGGMGVVYKAFDVNLNRPVALKFLIPEISAGSEKARFLREAQAASTLDHPNIGTIFSIEADADRPFIVMAYYEGETLQQRLGRGSLITAQAVDVTIQIARGLAHAHARGIIHRDIKPSNIILTPEHVVKIVDFGLAKMDDGADLTKTGVVMGTSGYMSPEQATGTVVDARTDIWSLGVVLYAMLTAGLPFRGKTRDSKLYNIVHEPPIPITGAPADLEHAIFKCLAKDPSGRYQRAVELLADLEALDCAPAGAATVPVIRQDPDRPEGRSPSHESIQVERTRSNRSRRLGFAAAAGLGLLMAAGILLISPIRRELGIGDGGAVSKHIAVLPFRNVGEDPENQALCDGLLETITSRLSDLETKKGSLWVVPSNEVRQRKVADADAARREFGVTLAVTGSVQRSRTGVRLTIALIETGNPRQRGSAVLDEPSGDLLALQDAAVSRLAALMDVESPRRSDKNAAVAPAVYESYLKGLGYVQRYDKAGNLDRAIQSFEDAIGANPRFALAYSGLAEAYRRRYETTRDAQDIPKATDACNRAIALDSQLAPVYITLGRIHAASGQPELALAEFQHALSLEPRSADGLQGMARAYESLGRVHEAEDLLKRAAALQPDYWESFNRLGSFYYAQGRYPEAILQFRRVIELTPDNIAGYSNLSTTYRKMGRLSEAQTLLESAIKLGPNYAVYSNLGVLYLDGHRYTDALAMIEKALQLNDKDYRLWGNLALAYAFSGSAAKSREAFARAAALAEQALKLQPQDAILNANLSKYYGWLGRRNDALLRLNAALARAPDDQQVFERAAETYLQLGMREQAVEAVNRAFEHGYTTNQLRQDPELEPIMNEPRLKLKH